MRARSHLNQSVRAFFDARGVLEVETPILSRFGTVDPHIDSIAAENGRWLHTSPEFAMKRLICAGSGAIYQMSPVFRAGESGTHHNPEFRMLEWYRPEWGYHALMDEVEALFRHLMPANDAAFERQSYRAAFIRHAEFDPLTENVPDIAARASEKGVPPLDIGTAETDRSAWLDQWLSFCVAPRLGFGAPVFVYDFPMEQAALSRIRPGPGPSVAERFELFFDGLELANGYQELTAATELEARFVGDSVRRQQLGKSTPMYDRCLVAAQHSGMPFCSGVALGVDRLLMLKLGLPDIASTMSFDYDRA